MESSGGSLALASGAYSYLEGQGDSESRLIMGIMRVTIWVIGVINPSKNRCSRIETTQPYNCMCACNQV